jgi:hypothetical protein
MVPIKSPPFLEVVFEGENISPEEIPLRSLATALSAVQRLTAVGGVAEEQEEGEGEAEAEDVEPVVREPGGSLRLLEVKRGSAVFQLGVPAGTELTASLERLRGIGEFLASGEDTGAIDYDVLRPIKELSATARGLHCTISFREVGGADAVLARIEPDSYKSVAGSLFVEGQTSFIGRVQRVGGVTGMRCGLRVSFQKRMLICKVASKAVAQTIGKRLYEELVVQGTAQWLKKSWRVVAFTVHSVEQPKQGSILGAFEELRKAGGKMWDTVGDPSAYLEEVTGER